MPKSKKGGKKKSSKKEETTAAPVEEVKNTQQNSEPIDSKVAMKKAEEAKKSGNTAFSGGNYQMAIKFFTEAITLMPEEKAYYSNRSAAYMKLKQLDQAVEDGRKCVELAPKWGKGYSRLASALLLQGEAEEAVSIYAQGIACDPSNTTLTKGLAQAQARLNDQTKNGKKRKKEDQEGLCDRH
jgi:Flp pilus assembly protein TadD